MPYLGICEHYQNDRSCLTCPYPEEELPCMRPQSWKLQVVIDPKIRSAIEALSGLSGEPIGEVSRALLKQGLERLRPEVKQQIKNDVVLKHERHIGITTSI